MSPSSPIAGTPDTSLELNDHDPTSSKRRISARMRTRPALLSDDAYLSHASNGVKRKRVDPNDVGLEDLSDDELDEEDLKEKRRKARGGKKPAKKKARAEGGATRALAMRPAGRGANGVRKPAKKGKGKAVASSSVAEEEEEEEEEKEEGGLYAEVFTHNHSVDAVAANWISQWEQHNSQAMTDLINLVLRCTGCNLSVDVHDIEDPDNAVNRLTDLQEEFQAQKPADYPLISKLKANASFRSTLTGFFKTLIQSCHAAGLLYSDLAIIENLEIWVSTMSSSGSRPFRHTATVISLAIGSQLCRVAAEMAESTAKSLRQKEVEQKKKSVNKQRVKAFDNQIADSEKKRLQLEESLQISIFDTVFVHRYRDVDAKIRVDCVTALGDWILTLPDKFFEGMYLRYLGWLLADTFAPTRAEVIRQLTRLYKHKDNVARMRIFTERFRSRLVEMAMRDSEVAIRASTVELLDLIRGTGLLEPDDIDNIGRLIFDAEPRVRKAVTDFFAENISDTYENSIEELGGSEALIEALGDEIEEDYDAPRMSWLRMKGIVETLQSYDDADEQDAATIQDLPAGLLAAGNDSRYKLAAHTICEGIEEARKWEVIAGYLLYDLSTADTPFEQRCKLEAKEEILLLEILTVSAKGRLLEALDAEKGKKGTKSKIQKAESREIQESTALHLAKVIPDLLKKFGSNSATASAVLRLEHVLDLEIFQELRQDSTEYASLLEDINKQFLTHADSAVLAEASTALLHARTFEDLEEVTEGKVQELWDDTLGTLRSCMSVDDWTDNLAEICSTVRRIAHLASIMNCAAIFEAESALSRKSKKQTAASESSRAVNILLTIVKEPALDTEAGEEGDETLIGAMKALLFYYMWTAQSLQQANYKGEREPLYPDYAPFSSALLTIIEGRHAASPVRIAAIGTILDLHTLFATFRHRDAPLQSLVQHIDPAAEVLILSTFTALEKAFARKSRRKLDLASPDDELDSAPEDSDEEDELDDETQGAAHIQQQSLLAEQRLCEISGKIVLAIVARVLDHSSRESNGKIRTRISHNRLKLGPNFKEIIAYLDGPKSISKSGGRKTRKVTANASRKATQAAAKARSRTRVRDDDDDSDEDDGIEFEEGGEEDLRERELVEDRIMDPDEEKEGADVRAGAQAPDGDEDEDEDEIMGD